MEARAVDGPVSRSRRTTLADPVSEAAAAMLTQLFGVLIAAAGVGGVLAWLASRNQAAHPALMITDAVMAVGWGAALIAIGRLVPGVVHRRFEPLVYTVLLLATFAVTVGQVSIGPASVVVVMLYVEVPIFAVFLLRAPYAAGIVAIVDVQFALVMVLQPGYAFPWTQLAFFSVTLPTIAAIVGGLLHHGVREANRMAGLRRFLSEPIADAILASGTEPLLEAHRRKIGVLFCDLRGFTRFASQSEPEEVLEVLGEYFETVGQILHRHRATVGMFAGDGILAYIGDPVVSADPAGEIVQLALDLRQPLAELSERWERRGHRVSYGIGVSFGYATLGVIGFEGRYDYTALGPVVNLAARLSDEATAGEVLIDDRCYRASGADLDVTACSLPLKGYDEAVAAHRLPGVRTDGNVRQLPTRHHTA